MDKRVPYAQTIELEEKKKIWSLYFYKLYSYDDLIKYFKGKYTYAQLKSIIFEKIRMAEKRDKNGNTK